MIDAHADLRRELEDYCGLEVAAYAGALQLLPENSHHADRLVALATVALASSGSKSPSRADLVRWLVDRPSLHIGPAWDPYECPFCEPVTFVGGGYLLQTGGDPEAVFQTRRLLWAVLGTSSPFAALPLATEAAALAFSVLALGTHMSNVSGLRRYADPARTEAVVIPESVELEVLRRAVSFTAEELDYITGRPPQALERLTFDLRLTGPPDQEPGGTPFARRPIVVSDDLYVVVEPGALATALRHTLVAIVLDAGLRAELVDRMGEIAVAEAVDAMERMGWHVFSRRPASDGPVVSVLGRFDVDKACAMTILYEDLENWSDDVSVPWDPTSWEGVVERQLRAIEERLLYGSPPRPNEVLHVVVLAGVGRPASFGLKHYSRPLVGRILLFTAESLAQITVRGLDALALWKHAEASERLRERCHVLAMDPIAEFAAWAAEESFYFGDDRRPTMVLFDGSHGLEYRQKVARESDVHGVLAPEDIWLDAIRLEDEPEIQIYLPRDDLDGQPRFLVEGLRVPVWVLGTEEIDTPAHRRRTVELVDCIAYWIWQMTPSLSPLVDRANVSRLQIAVRLETTDRWKSLRPHQTIEP